MEIYKIMWITIISAVMIVVGTVFLLLSTLPMKNELDGNELVVKFVLGKKVIDVSGAVFKPVPEEVYHNMIRVFGTSVGKKQSGNFMNTKTRTKYVFYLTGEGEKMYFEIGDKKYLVDGVCSTL